MFKKFLEFTPSVWIALIALIMLGVVLLAVRKQSKHMSTRMLAYAALCIALSFVLSYIRLYRMPQGGSITPASMLPLIAFAYLYGTGPGMLAGLAYGLLQMLQDPWIVHPVQAILDYPLAYAMMGLAGFAHRLPVRKGLIVGVCLATVGRFVCAVLSGVVFFGSSTPVGQNALLYSMGYNLSYLGPDALVCALVCLIPGMGKAIERLGKSA